MHHAVLGRVTVVVAPFFAAALGGCPPAGDGGPDAGVVPPRPASQRALTLSDANGAVPTTPGFTLGRFVVARGDDVVVLLPVGSDDTGRPQQIAAVRLGADDSVKWAKRFTLPEPGFVGGAVDTGAGVAFIAGMFGADYVVRIDDDGAVTQAQAYSQPGGFDSTSATAPNSLAALDDGGLLLDVTGRVARVDAAGAIVWKSDVGGVAVQRLAVLPDGDFAFVGGIGGQTVSRTSPDGTVLFVGDGGIVGNSFHAGIAPSADGGFVVVSGVDHSQDLELHPIYAGTYAADGSSATYAEVKLDTVDQDGLAVPLQFGAGFHLVIDDDGVAWASSDANSGALGSNIQTETVVGFRDGQPIDAVFAARVFTVANHEVVGLNHDVLVRVPRPQSGTCVAAPTMSPVPAPNPTYALRTPTPTGNDVDVSVADAAVVVDDLTAALSDDACAQ